MWPEEVAGGIWGLRRSVIPRELVIGPGAKQAAVLGTEVGVVLRGHRTKGCRGIQCGLEIHTVELITLQRRNLYKWKKEKIGKNPEVVGWNC